jgi:hypothetical protein
VAVNLGDSSEDEILFAGSDFVSSPSLSPDGNSVAFITWSHPNMPWDDTQLRILKFASDGSVKTVIDVPKNGNIAIKNPEYAEDG